MLSWVPWNDGYELRHPWGSLAFVTPRRRGWDLLGVMHGTCCRRKRYPTAESAMRAAERQLTELACATVRTLAAHGTVPVVERVSDL